MPEITFESATVDTSSEDQDGRLVFADGILEAVVVQIAAEYGDIAKRGCWFLEAGFGACCGSGDVFASLDDVRAWVARQLRGAPAPRGHQGTPPKNAKALRNVVRRTRGGKTLATLPDKQQSAPSGDRRQKRRTTLGELLYATPGDTIREHTWARLIPLIAAGDLSALHTLYDMAHRFVFTLSVRITASRESAAELTLDVFHDIWRHASRYDAADGPVLAWIMRQARARALARFVPMGAEAEEKDVRDILEPDEHGPSLPERLAHRIAQDTGSPIVAPSAYSWSEPEWELIAPGIACMLLATDTERHRISMLVRLAPGASYPAHTHADSEELHLLAGELCIDGRKFLPGDYNHGAPGATDERVWTETGCTCALITSTEDVLRLSLAG